MQRFTGKTAIVTGSSSGIGEGCARRFAAEGANVVLVARDREKLDKVAADLDPDRTLVCEADVSQREEVDRMVEAVADRFGAIDILHSNAGIAVMKPFEDTTPEEWRNVMATDIDGMFHCAQAALPHLKASKGCIIHTASVSGTGGDWNMTAYDAAKGAVVNFTRALALDLGKHGVRVNAVAPSLTESELTAGMLDDEELLAKFHERFALGRHATPEDIAGPVAFLASEDARFVTGAILPVDGGMSASNGQPPQ
ncbi:3-oxoacyl-ACP reductase [Altererythrobacter sp. B11]|uniref:SDR family NAD(P)-dependent oxidoreductase n=1 Tax=Altererythrobacter sp. B11 TaxID=2060312 RepID=UPI000DC6F045|nr:SDR family NAD(P)-dependent oxidoreductase [Altererythrobacter sp. B11]BBC73920.1 3-oxoacyl-ACP reductase [Altererythrobacter sp. B11]